MHKCGFIINILRYIIIIKVYIKEPSPLKVYEIGLNENKYNLPGGIICVTYTSSTAYFIMYIYMYIYTGTRIYKKCF